MKRIRIISLVFACISLIGASSCSKDTTPKDPLLDLKKEVLVAQIHEQENSIAAGLTRIGELETLLKGIQTEEKPSAAISTMADGTGRLTFNSFNGSIIFPVEFQYPGATQVPASGEVNITNVVSVAPSNNWCMMLNGSTIEMSHKSGIDVVVKVAKSGGTYPMEMLPDKFKEFFTEFPPDEIKYSKVYANNNWCGMEAITQTRIDENDAQLRCGMLGVGDIAITYMSVYQGQKDATKDELVHLLLSTIKIFGSSIAIE